MRGQIHGPDLRPLFGDELHLDAVTRQDLLESFPIVATVGIVGIDAGHSLELALEILDRQQRSHHRFAFVVGRAENVAWIRHRLLDAVLSGAVPHHQQRLLFLRYRRDPEADAGRNQSMNRLDLFLQNQTPKALDRVLWVGLFFEHQLDSAPGDATVLVVVLVAAIASYFQHMLGHDRIQYVVAFLGLFMIFAMWLFPEVKRDESAGGVRRDTLPR